MSHRKIRGSSGEATEAPQPTFLEEAARAVVAGFPNRQVQIREGVFVSAFAVVDAFREFLDLPFEIEPQAIRAAVAEGIRAYTAA